VTIQLDDLLESLDRALSALKAQSESRHKGDSENLVRIKRILDGLAPDGLCTILEDEDE